MAEHNNSIAELQRENEELRELISKLLQLHNEADELLKEYSEKLGGSGKAASPEQIKRLLKKYSQIS